MKKMLIPALALVAASVAVPAMAQSYGAQHYNGGPRYEQNRGNSWQNISQRKYAMDQRIDRGERNRLLSRQEATRLRSELNSLVRLERSYMQGGLSIRERTDLDRRYNILGARIREERRDRDGRRY
ncbi:MAG: hypothetical protein ACK4VY_11085 [Brevundimonas sp.]